MASPSRGAGRLEPLILRLLSQGKRTLLPLRKAEKKAVIFPYDPTIQALEMKNLVRRAGEARTRGGRAEAAGAPRSRLPGALGQMPELLETLPVALLLAVLCGLDWALYSAFDVIRQHSFLQYSFRSERGPPGHPLPPNPHPCVATPPPFFPSRRLLLGSTLGSAARQWSLGASASSPLRVCNREGRQSAADLSPPLDADFPDTHPAPL